MVTFLFQIPVATCAVRRPQMRGATSSYGDQLNHTVALTPHSTPHSFTARQHATHHTLSPLNAEKPQADTRAETRGGGTPHKHLIPTADKRPRGGAERRGRGARDLGPAPGATHQKETPPTPNQRPPKPNNDKAHRARPPPPSAATQPRRW